jgi:hypothetical protein
VNVEAVVWAYDLIKAGAQGDLHGNEAVDGAPHGGALAPASGHAKGIQLIIHLVVPTRRHRLALQQVGVAQSCCGARVWDLGRQRLAAGVATPARRPSRPVLAVLPPLGHSQQLHPVPLGPPEPPAWPQPHRPQARQSLKPSSSLQYGHRGA